MSAELKDEFGFWVWDESDHERRWSDEYTFEEWLIKNKKEEWGYREQDSLPTRFRVADDELLFGYSYGGVLSKRIGFFVTKKDAPNRIVRSVMTMMS